jgi:hypothetical protein
MPLGYVRASSAPQECICFADWDIKDGSIVWLFNNSGNEFSRTPIPEHVTLETVGELYKDPNPDFESALHYFCFGDEFAIVAEKNNRAELDRFEKEVRRTIFKRDMKKLCAERANIWAELKRVETEIGNLWSQMC